MGIDAERPVVTMDQRRLRCFVLKPLIPNERRIVESPLCHGLALGYQSDTQRRGHHAGNFDYAQSLAKHEIGHDRGDWWYQVK